ncbi:hypothetical protein [Nioella aestuarii]|uniref:hypothetical protein n=1 Tax=Nioella aestuarii TaxID=1662864 RepID=UPI003D7FFD3A
MTTKIATCCYCGTRTMLRLTARGGHELACGNCGAPLHEMKAIPQEKVRKPKRVQPAPAAYRDSDDDYRSRKKKKPKRRKPLWSRALEEAFDFVEDIFD